MKQEKLDFTQFNISILKEIQKIIFLGEEEERKFIVA
jgi:hypothetical protein